MTPCILVLLPILSVTAFQSNSAADKRSSTSADTAALLARSGGGDASSGLWVCDPTIRHLLETAPSSVSRGEIFGRCRRTYTDAACTSAANALFRGPSVLANLQALCGDLPPSYQLINAGMVGAAPFKETGSGVGFGPLGEHVKVPGANGEAHTSFRGPISPPLTNVNELDKTTSGKPGGKKFSWEKASRQNSSAIDQAADAVRVFDAAGLAGGSSMESASRFPLDSRSRSADAIAMSNSTNISMNVTPPLPVMPQVVPEGELTQSAGDDVAQAPFAYAPYEGSWENDTYWQLEGPLPPAPAPAMLAGEHTSPEKLEGASKQLEDASEDENVAVETKQIQEHHHKRHAVSFDSDLDEDIDPDFGRPDSVANNGIVGSLLKTASAPRGYI